MEERIQKILSARGICSRRKAEEYIEQGLVKVNGEVATLGQKADSKQDEIEVDGKVLQDRQEMLYYLMNKPVGVETTNVEKSQGHKVTADNFATCESLTVRDVLPKELQGKIYPVGRLDKDTSGLLLFTNDGVLAYRLTHPKFYHEKEYRVETTDPITDGQLLKLRKGMTISGEKTKPAVVQRISEKVFSIALTEGKNRQIRRMCQKVGAPLRYLQRVRIVNITDKALQPGALRLLHTQELQELLDSLDITSVKQ